MFASMQQKYAQAIYIQNLIERIEDKEKKVARS